MRDEDFFLTSVQRAELLVILGRPTPETLTIPGVIEDLAVTTARQDRITKPGLTRGHRGKPESRPPMNFGSAAVECDLRATLVGAVRLICEHRVIDYDGDPSSLGMCSWVRRNHIALALTPGADDVLADLKAVLKAARRAIDIPEDIVITPERLEAANRSIVTRDTIDAVAARSGPICDGLNARRIRTLEQAGVLSAASTDKDTKRKFYRFGDVLRAHVAHPRGDDTQATA